MNLGVICKIHVVNEKVIDYNVPTNVSAIIPSGHQQDEGTVQNNCVWISICLVPDCCILYCFYFVETISRESNYIRVVDYIHQGGHLIVYQCRTVCDQKNISLLFAE